MEIGTGQNLKLSRKMVMTHQMRLMFKILQMSRPEFEEEIRRELEDNPTLEVKGEDDEKNDSEDSEGRKEGGVEFQEVTVKESIREDINWDNYINEFNTPGRVPFESEKKGFSRFETFTPARVSLTDHLLWQLNITFSPDEEKEREVGAAIICNTDADGYLKASPAEIAEFADASVSTVKEVLGHMQNFDPPGIFAKNLKECLLIQIRELNVKNSLAGRLVSNHLKELEANNLKSISRSLGRDVKEVAAAVRSIREMNPRPGRSFSEEITRYIIPDVYLHEEDGELIIRGNDEGLPMLRVSNRYAEMLRGGTDVEKDAKKYINEKRRSAAHFIRSVENRQNTICKVMKSILKFQRDFFENGVEGLKPMNLHHVADDAGIHESTVSRVVNNKYVHSPAGVFELRYFFSNSIARPDGGGVTPVAVRKRIRDIVEDEPPRKPYSDNAIADILKKSGLSIERRTVSKYRKLMGLPPSAKRKIF